MRHGSIDGAQESQVKPRSQPEAQPLNSLKPLHAASGRPSFGTPPAVVAPRHCRTGGLPFDCSCTRPQ